MRGRSVPITRSRLLAAAIAASALVPSASVHADVVDDAQGVLLAVEGFTATGISEEFVLLNWTRSTILARAFRIEVALDEAGPYQKVKTVSDAICNQNSLTSARCTTSVKLTTVPGTVAADPTPRFLRLVPLLAAGLPEQNAEQMPVLFEGKPSPADPAILGPKRPVNVQCNGGGALACVGVNSVSLTWTDRSDEDHFWVMRGRGATNANLGTTPFAELPANTTSFNDVIAEYGVFYTYRVVAVRQRAVPRLDPPNRIDTELSFSNGQPDAVVETAPIPPPTDPSGLTATFVPPSTVKLSWLDGAAPGFPYVDEDGWFIEQTDDSADFAKLISSQHSRGPKLGQGTVGWSTTVPPNELLCFRVRGYRATTTYTAPAYSGYTNTTCMGSPPSAPTNLTATALAADKVRLNWRDTSTSESNFVVQRCLGNCGSNASGWADLTTAVPMNAETYIDTSTLSQTQYSYRVLAESPSGRSSPSNIAKATTPEAPVPSPTGLVATATGSREITLTWNDVTSAETGFRIEYQDYEDNWQEMAEVGANVEIYRDETLYPNERRCYRIRTIKGSKISDPAGPACARALAAAAPNGDPSGLSAVVVSNTEIQLSFIDNATNESRFEIQYTSWPHLGCTQDPTGRTFTKLMDVDRRSGTGMVSVRADKLIPHTAYFFRVRAVNADGQSGFSNLAGCVQTYGPLLPEWIDPEEHGDVNATRCDFTIKQPMTGPDGAGGLRVYVNAQVAGSIGHTDTLYVINSGGTVPGSTHDPDRNQYIKTPGNGLTINSTNETWTISYNFRRGIKYRIIATAYGLNDPYYASAANDRRDVTVLADCPVNI